MFSYKNTIFISIICITFASELLCVVCKMTDTIKHLGTVEHIEGSHIQVRIVQMSACSSCTAKAYCHSSESKEKLIDLYDADASQVKVGDEVMVYGTTSMGMRAVVLAFGVPFLILIIALFIAYSYTEKNEILSGIIAIFSVIPYYIILYLCKDKLKRNFSFTLKSINN